MLYTLYDILHYLLIPQCASVKNDILILLAKRVLQGSSANSGDLALGDNDIIRVLAKQKPI